MAKKTRWEVCSLKTSDSDMPGRSRCCRESMLSVVSSVSVSMSMCRGCLVEVDESMAISSRGRWAPTEDEEGR